MSQFSNLYQNHRWRKLRAAQLEREPLCRYCKRQGRITVATVCDHVIPHKGDLTLFWKGNLSSLCASCHSAVKQREEASGIVIGGDTDGNPIDPKHHWNQ